MKNFKEKFQEFLNSDKCLKLKSFKDKYGKRILQTGAVAVLGVAIILVAGESKTIGNNSIIPFSSQSETKNEVDELVLQDLLKSINNSENISEGSINSQIKFLTLEDNSYTDLMSLTLVSNLHNNNDSLNLRGFLSMDISSFDIDLKFPILINDLKNENYEIYLDIPSSYKSSFGMNDTQDYLYANKESFKYINENYKLFNSLFEVDATVSEIEMKDILLDNNKPVPTLLDDKFKKQEFDDFKNVKCTELEDKSKLYDISLDTKEVKLLFNTINNHPDFKDSYLLRNLLNILLKNEENINNINSFVGQVAVNKDVATDIYFEIEYKSGSVVAVRMTFTNINNNLVEIEKFDSENTKNFTEFIDLLNLTNNNSSNVEQTDKKITIGNVYFTGEDESTKISSFDKSNLPSVINVFLNFTECTKHTNLLIKWFYGTQEVPIVETKISNGEYEKGMLKSSISFSDINSVQAGTYTLKIYIEGQETVIGEASFTITDAKDEIQQDVLPESNKLENEE